MNPSLSLRAYPLIPNPLQNMSESRSLHPFPSGFHHLNHTNRHIKFRSLLTSHNTKLGPISDRSILLFPPHRIVCVSEPIQATKFSTFLGHGNIGGGSGSGILHRSDEEEGMADRGLSGIGGKPASYHALNLSAIK